MGKKLPSLLVFIVIVVGGGLLIGFIAAPGEWYEALSKPSFNPPNWIFGPAWTALYFLIAVAGWRAWIRDNYGVLTKIWWGQLGINFLWSPIFFAGHLIGIALVVILALFVMILAFIALGWNRDRIAALLFLPYAAWVTFASVLNAAIFQLN